MPAKTEARCEGCGRLFEPRLPTHRLCTACWAWVRNRQLIQRAARLLPTMRG